MNSKLTIDHCREFINQNLFNPVHTNNRQNTVGLIGIELESIPLLRSDKTIGFQLPPLFDIGFSVANSLIKFSSDKGGIAQYTSQCHEEYNLQLENISLPDGSKFQFEPGGQTEITTKPCSSIGELEKDLAFCQDILDKVTEKDNIQFLQFGMNRWFSVQEIGLQNNSDRYDAMARYFDKLGPYGKQMMLQTCSMHINCDLGTDPETRSKRLLLSNLLVPFTSAIFSNSLQTTSYGEKIKSYRRYIWNHLDPSRTGVLFTSQGNDLMTLEKMIEKYLEFALEAPVIFAKTFNKKSSNQNLTFNFWLSNSIEGAFPSISDFEIHLSQLFPEVRLRGYIEIRNIDTPPRKWQLIPVMFYSALLYQDDALEKALELLLPIRSKMQSYMSKSTLGLKSDELYEYAIKLMSIAIDGYNALPAAFVQNSGDYGLIQFMNEYPIKRRSFADDE